MDFNQLLKNKFVFLDGAMGTELQARGLKLGGVPEILNFTHSEWIEDIHKTYISAGANIIYTNTFGANRYKLEETDKTTEEVITEAIKIAKSACKGTDTLVALDIGPIGQL